MQLLDIEDIDFQRNNDSLTAKWFGFESTHSNVTYTVCVVAATGNNIKCANVERASSFTFTGLSLEPYTVSIVCIINILLYYKISVYFSVLSTLNTETNH